MPRAADRRRAEVALRIEPLEPRLALSAADLVVGDAQFVRYDDGVYGTMAPEFSRGVETIDAAGNTVAVDERRFGAEQPIATDLQWTDTGVFVATQGVTDVLGSGWDHDGVTPLLVAQDRSGEQLVIYRGESFEEMGRLDYRDGDMTDGAFADRRYLPRGAIVYHGLIVIAALRFEMTPVGEQTVGVDFFTTQDYGQTLEIVPQADGFDRTPRIDGDSANGKTHLRTWSFLNPFPLDDISETNAAWIPWADYIEKFDKPKGGQVGLFRVDRDTDTGLWEVRPNRVIASEWIDEDSGGYHVHTAAMTTGGVVAHWGDVGYRNKTDFYALDLDNYETAPITTTTVFGGYSTDTTENRIAPQPVAAAPSPEPGHHLASGDNTPDQVLSFGSLEAPGDRLEVEALVYQPFRAKAGNRFGGQEVLHLHWLQGVGYASGHVEDPFLHFSPDGEQWASVSLPEGARGRLWVYGGGLLHLKSDGEFAVAGLPQFDRVEPLQVAPGGTNRVGSSLEADIEPGGGNTVRQVVFSDGLWRYADTLTPLDQQADPPPFLTSAPVYEVVVDDSVLLGSWYLQPSDQTQDTSESQLIEAWAANLTDQSATPTMNLRVLEGGSGAFLRQSGHEVAETDSWTPIGVNGEIPTDREARVLVDLRTLVRSPGSRFLVATPYFGESDTPPYPLAPQASGPNEIERIESLTLGDEWSAGLVFRWPENAPMSGKDRMPVASLVGPTGEAVEISVTYTTGNDAEIRADFFRDGELTESYAVEDRLLRGDWVELTLSSGVETILTASVASRDPVSDSRDSGNSYALDEFRWASRDGATVSAVDVALVAIDGDAAWTADQHAEWLRGSLGEKSVFNAKPAPGDFNLDGVVDDADRDLWEATLFVPNPGGPGDANGDGFVDDDDAAIWSEQFGQSPFPPGDANRDGTVNIADYTVVMDATANPLPARPGDGDRDGFVGSRDYDIWVEEFGQSGDGLRMDVNADGVTDLRDYTAWRDLVGTRYDDDAADFNRDGEVGEADFAIWSDAFGWDGVELTADFNADGQVNLQDYTIWRDNRGPQLAPGSGADGDRSGYVDAADEAIWQANLGVRYPTLAELLATPQAGTAAPEPAQSSAPPLVAFPADTQLANVEESAARSPRADRGLAPRRLARLLLVERNESAASAAEAEPIERAGLIDEALAETIEAPSVSRFASRLGRR